jgi:predicted secreted protein
MAATNKVLARNYTIEVYDGIAYVPIKGINTLTISTEKESSDTTTFDSNGMAEHLATQRAKTISAEGYEYYDEAGVQDAGQAEVENLSDAVGTAAESTLHIVHDNSGREKWLNGTFNLSDIGGGNNDPSSWGFEFERTGASLDTDPNGGV